MASRKTIFTTIRTEGALLPADLLGRISEGANIDGLTPASYHRPDEKLNEAINRSWNALQGAWASFRAAQERLPDNDLGTSITRERWLLPLFRELDYGRLQTATAVEIDGRSYPISHGWEHVPIHLVSYKLELDRRTPGAAGASTASPHSLVQVFLNRSEDNLWGFLSNGYKLRILRDNVSLTRQAYVEFDLEAMMEGEVYSDFVLLWLLCHQSRVEGERPSDCWLEKWMKVAEDQGTRALDQLRDGVEQAIEALGLGFLDYHANAALRDKLTDGTLDKQEYYRQLLRMVYRLLFLFVAEDRELLLNPDAPQDAHKRYVDYYSTQRLRGMAESFKGTRHPDLFESLRLVMRLLSGDSAPTPDPSPLGGWEKQVSPHEGERFREGAAGLGLVPLGSFLFSDRAVSDIIDCQISNQHLLTAVRALSLTYDQRAQVYRTVDYKHLGSDELGSIFESLLELHPQINVPARQFALATAAGNERKTTGSYYTPESLVHALLDSALDPVLEEAIRGPSKATVQPPSPTLPLARHGEGSLRPPSPALPPHGEGSLRPPSPTLPPHGEGSQERMREMATKAMRDIARDLRQRQTPAETILWEALRKNRLGGLGFRRQHPAANTSYVVDFFCYSANLIVELDGEIHQFQGKADSQRQAELESLGYRVLRFPNQRVIDDLENVLVEILNAAIAPSAGASGGGENTRADKSPHLRGGDLEGGLTAEERILALKVCDPACGSGHFLIAAANRMAKALAFVRTGEEEPPPAAIQQARRDIIGHCIYGVDINPMAVELCKVNLWMEALEPGKPLSFLDHRILAGNSLLGTTPRLMAEGIPDDAFSPIEGDDPKLVSALKKQNKQERKDRETGQRSMFELIDPPADYAHLTQAMHALDTTPDDTLDAVRRKEAQYAALASDPEYIKARLLADAWCAAFVWEKKAPKAPTPGPSAGASGGEETAQSGEVLPHEGEGFRMGAKGGHFPLPLTDLLYRRMERDPLAENLQAVRAYVVELKERYQFFHWHVAFPDVFWPAPTPGPSPLGGGEQVRGQKSPHLRGGDLEGGQGDYNPQTGWHGGFDVVLGNPPWERIKIQEKEWFAERAPEIATAPNAAARRRMIAALTESDPSLLAAFADDKRKAEGESHFVRVSGRFPLCGRGDVNTYTIFAETSRHIINGFGRVGVIVPSGIATDNTTRFFFQDLITSRSLDSLYEFENEGFFGAGQGHMVRFVLMTMTGYEIVSMETDFVFQGKSLSDLSDKTRHFTLSSEDIEAINPNTLTCPIFEYGHDAYLAKQIYRLVPVLIEEGDPEINSWGINFLAMFHMSGASDKFATADDLETQGYSLKGNYFMRGDDLYLPLYEAKMVQRFNHRHGDFFDGERGHRMHILPDVGVDRLQDPSYVVKPFYWIDREEVDARLERWDYGWLYGWRDVTDSRASARTVIASVIPRVAVNDKYLLMLPNMEVRLVSCLISNLDSFCLDYCARQKIGGIALKYYLMKQFPVIPPHTYTPALLDFIVPRVLELTYTAWDLQPFARDVGYDGPPFIWDEERRFLLRCELDALYFHLYGISRDDVDYIMETFPIVKRKDIARTAPTPGPSPSGGGEQAREEKSPHLRGGDLEGGPEGGEYITKRIILEMYDQMAALPTMAVPAPKDESATYAVPDVSGWATWLNPPPASPAMAHGE